MLLGPSKLLQLSRMWKEPYKENVRLECLNHCLKWLFILRELLKGDPGFLVMNICTYKTHYSLNGCTISPHYASPECTVIFRGKTQKMNSYRNQCNWSLADYLLRDSRVISRVWFQEMYSRHYTFIFMHGLIWNIVDPINRNGIKNRFTAILQSTYGLVCEKLTFEGHENTDMSTAILGLAVSVTLWTFACIAGVRVTWSNLFFSSCFSLGESEPLWQYVPWAAQIWDRNEV